MSKEAFYSVKPFLQVDLPIRTACLKFFFRNERKKIKDFKKKYFDALATLEPWETKIDVNILNHINASIK